MTRASHAALAGANAVALLAMLVLNGLANALPLNGLNTGEIADLYPNLFVPAGLTFSIWGLIYAWLLAFVVFGAVRAGRRDRSSAFLAAIGPWFVVNGVANALWIVAWHWLRPGLALLLMFVLLASLLAMYKRLGVGARPVPAAERWLVHAPVSVYLGWITVATIANVTALAVHIGAPQFGLVPAVLTVVVLLTAVCIALAALGNRRDVAFAAVSVWAFVGIWLKRSGAPEPGSAIVAWAALAGIVVLVLAIAAVLLRGRRVA